MSQLCIPLENDIKLQHQKQKYNWDCGLACIMMVLPEQNRKHLIENFSIICKEEGFNKSTWTIDLCYVLRRYKMQHKFCTLTLGVHHGYKKTEFYEKVFSKDEERVNTKFNEALNLGFELKQTAITLDDIFMHLLKGPVIVLTNARLLSCEICKHNKISTELRKCLPLFMPYQGHYIVLSGYNIRKQVIHYHNPAFSDHVCSMKFACFEEARKSYGTDEDVIFVYN